MAFRSEENQEIYREYIWPLLAGTITPSQLAKKHGMNRSTPGMWIHNARKKLGGKETAKQLALMVENGETELTKEIIEDLHPKQLCAQLAEIANNLPKPNKSNQSFEEELEEVCKNLILNVKGVTERGYIRYAKQDCTGAPVLLQRDLSPRDLKDLSAIVDYCDRLDNYVEERKIRRTKKYKSLREREQKADNWIAICSEKEKLIALAGAELKNQYEEVKSLKKSLEAKMEALEENEAA